MGFSTLNLAIVLGQSIGLVLGSVVDYGTSGWRFELYFCGATTIAMAIVNCFVLPLGMSNPQLSWGLIARNVD